MCGRYMITAPVTAMTDLFDVADRPNLAARYNVAPMQDAPVIRLARGEDAESDPGARRLVLHRWGLLPFWAKAAREGAKMINARAETVATKPAFRDAFKHRRCLVITDGFYEWRTEGKTKQPFAIRLRDNALFAFAGLWSRWRPTGDGQGERPVDTFTILTTVSNPLIAPIHDRMPVILPDDAHETWLSGPPQTAQGLLQPYPADRMHVYPVDRRVGNVRNDDPTLIEPIPTQTQLL